MAEKFHMRIEDVFSLRDGRTVLAGTIEEGEHAILIPGASDLLVDGRKLATVHIEPEMIASRPLSLKRLETRSVSTRDSISLTREQVANQVCTLEGAMRVIGHRHLLGLDSPPSDYVPDDMTLGPRLPVGWDGDAWIRPEGGSYFLRAWNKSAASYAIGCGNTYEEARRQLLEEVARGGRSVELPAKDEMRR